MQARSAGTERFAPVYTCSQDVSLFGHSCMSLYAAHRNVCTHTAVSDPSSNLNFKVVCQASSLSCYEALTTNSAHATGIIVHPCRLFVAILHLMMLYDVLQRDCSSTQVLHAAASMCYSCAVHLLVHTHFCQVMHE